MIQAIKSLIPPFDFHQVIVDPWTQSFGIYGWIMLMGTLVTLSCGVLGVFIMLRRLSLLGDSISHSVLPGIVIAFLVAASRSTPYMIAGAILAGVSAAWLIDWIHRNSRIKQEAAMGIVFSLFFALGVILMSLFADHVDIDADCVLFGEIAYIPYYPMAKLGSLSLGPVPVVRMLVVLLILSTLILCFFKELVLLAFDPVLASASGLPVKWIHHAMMLLLALVIVSSFESVGVILVVGMLVFPPATAALISDQLKHWFIIVSVLSVFYGVLGLHLALWLDTSIAGSMVVVAIGFFVAAWLWRAYVKYHIRTRRHIISQQSGATTST